MENNLVLEIFRDQQQSLEHANKVIGKPHAGQDKTRPLLSAFAAFACRLASLNPCTPTL